MRVQRFLWAVLLMATVVVANLAVFSDASGGSNQAHLVYATNQQRWFCFVVKTKTATTVACFVSSSADLTTATWAEASGSPSPAFASAEALTTNDQRNMACAFLNPTSSTTTDAVHVLVASWAAGASAPSWAENIRATFTGTSTITWDAAWLLTSTAGQTNTSAVRGVALGVSSDGHVHAGGNGLAGDDNTVAQLSSNADTTATWTNAWGATADVDTSASTSVNSYAFAALASAAVLLVYDNGDAVPNCTGLRYNKYVSGTTWPTAGSADVGIGSSTQDKNDWCLVRVDATHIYAIRRSGANTFLWRKHDGVSTWSTPAANVPNQNHLAGSGLFACKDGMGGFYLFLLDSATNQPLQYIQCFGAGGANPGWGTWTQLEAAGASARNYISGCPTVGNNQIGVLFTQANGSNFDIVVTAINLPLAPTVTAVSPASGTAAGGTTVTVTGTNFTTATHVTFGTLPAIFTVTNATTISATSPGQPPGTVDVVVSNSAGTSAISASDQYTYTAGTAVEWLFKA